jgi:hypothetical protein
MSMATMVVAPTARAAMIAESPTAPAPKEAKLIPGRVNTVQIKYTNVDGLVRVNLPPVPLHRTDLAIRNHGAEGCTREISMQHSVAIK